MRQGVIVVVVVFGGGRNETILLKCLGERSRGRKTMRSNILRPVGISPAAQSSEKGGRVILLFFPDLIGCLVVKYYMYIVFANMLYKSFQLQVIIQLNIFLSLLSLYCIST